MVKCGITIEMEMSSLLNMSKLPNEPFDHRNVDVVYIAASGADTRLARVCIASVRLFYPNVPIRILPGGAISAAHLHEFKRYSNVDVAGIPVGDYGWGFVKLEALFGPAGERFLVLDSDTVITGPVLQLWESGGAPFLVNYETPSQSEICQIYYDWEKVRQIDGASLPPKFLFNSGQWFGTAGLISREDLSPLIEWSFPRRLRHPEPFMPGDQGVLNYLLNQKMQHNRFRVDRLPLMVWPGRGMQGLTAQGISDGTAPATIVHWAGMKKALHRNMVGCDLLKFFEECYYHRISAGSLEMIYDQTLDIFVSQWYRAFRKWLKCLLRYKIVPLFRYGKSQGSASWRNFINKRILAKIEYRIRGTRYCPRHLLDQCYLRPLEFDDVICRRMYDVGRNLIFIQVGAFDEMRADPLRKYITDCGWRGVMLEPQSDAAGRLRKFHDGNDSITVLDAALDHINGTRILFTVTSQNAPVWASGLASFDRQTVVKHSDLIPGQEDMIREETVKCFCFDEILHMLPSEQIDLLQIDTDGTDADILALFPFDRIRPAIIHWKIKRLSKLQQEATMDILSAYGYRFSSSKGEDMMALAF